MAHPCNIPVQVFLFFSQIISFFLKEVECKKNLYAYKINFNDIKKS